MGAPEEGPQLHLQKGRSSGLLRHRGHGLSGEPQDKAGDRSEVPRAPNVVPSGRVLRGPQ